MKLPAYPKYKDVDLTWAKRLPEGWTHASLKHVCARITDGSHFSPVSTDSGLPYVTVRNIDTGKVDIDNAARIAEEDFRKLEKAGCRPSKGDILFSKDGTVGKVALVGEDEFVVLSSLAILTPDLDKLVTEYLLYYMQSSCGLSQLESLYAGAALKRITLDAICGIRVSLPSLRDQSCVVAFLNSEITKIDAMVREQQRLIELLKEKRQAVIADASTKGLNPNAPMKDSGVRWIGRVPQHWQVKRLKHIKATRPNAFVDGPFGSNLKSEHFVENGDVYVIESNFATTGILETAELKTISAEHFQTIQRSEVNTGDIVIAKIGAQFGKASILPSIDKPAVVSGNSLKLTVNDALCSAHWAHLQLVNLKQSGEIDLLANGSAQPALSLSAMNQLVFLLPPKIEQDKIAKYLDRELRGLDQLAAAANNVIDLLQQRRTALISAAVTGKIDVRGLAKGQSA